LQATEARTKITLPAGIICERIVSYSLDRMIQLLTNEVSTQLSDYPLTYTPARYAVTFHRITCRSVISKLGNRPTVASALLALAETGMEPLSLPSPKRKNGSTPSSGNIVP